MKQTRWMVMATVLAVLAMGCGGAATSSRNDVGSSEQSLVVEYHDADIEAGKAHVDLTLENVVYVLEASDATKLATLRVVTEEGIQTISDLVGSFTPGAQSIVIGSAPHRVDAYLAGEGREGTAVSTRDGLGVSLQALRKVRCCASCEDVGGGGIGPLVCSGCGGCND